MDTERIIVALIAVGVIILVAFPVHEFSHAWTAFRLGDSTARYQGRLTLDPRSHFDPIGGIVLIASAVLAGFPIGWARPTPVNPYNLAYGRRGEVLVSVAGPLSNLVLAAAVAIPVRLIWADAGLMSTIATSLPLALLFNVAWFFVLINVVLFIFNLLPIPPLDGWRALLGLVDVRLAYTLRQVEPYGLLLLLGIILFARGPISALIFGLLDVFVAGARMVQMPL